VPKKWGPPGSRNRKPFFRLIDETRRSPPSTGRSAADGGADPDNPTPVILMYAAVPSRDDDYLLEHLPNASLIILPSSSLRR
jgi:hypothetical protein